MSKKSTLTILAELAGIIGLVIAIIFGINQWKSSHEEPHTQLVSGLTDASNTSIVNFIDNYYDVVLRRDYTELANYFNFPVERFYEFTQVSETSLINQLKDYNAKWKYQRINVDRETLRVVDVGEGQQRVHFILDYQVKRQEKDRYKDFTLEIVMLLGDNGKLHSIYEMEK